jgi:N utilization substance protein A
LTSRKLKSSQTQQVQPRSEYLQVAEVVAREKGIEKNQVLEAMEAAIQYAARSKYGTEYDIRARINRHTGALEIVKVLTVVETVLDPLKEISEKDAIAQDASCVLDDTVEEELPIVDFGRIAAQTARSVINQRVREAERKGQYDQYQNKIGHIVSGVVKRMEFGNVIVDLGQGEGLIKREDLIPRESFRVGDRVRAVMSDLKPENRGPIAFLSRTHPLMMARLFEQEVPEIYEGVIEVKSVARDPGSRAKMAVYTSDSTLDPVGSCVGVRGSRVQAVVNELQGEKVDIIMWSEDVATYIVRALQPATVSKVVIDEDAHRVDVVVPQDQLSLAIGRRGQNVRLASMLTSWSIDVMTDEDETQKRLDENETRINAFMQALDVDEMLAQLLCTEGFLSLEDVAYVPLEDFSSIEGFDEELAEELQNRAKSSLATKKKEVEEKIKKHQIDERLLTLVQESEQLNMASLEVFMNNKIFTLDDLAELSGEELLDLLGRHSMQIEEANSIIMKARAHWF